MNIIPVASQNMEEILATLQQGGVVAAPTDTVYGLLADATNERAVKNVFLVKGREEGKPLPVFVSSIAMAKEYAKINKNQEEILSRVWPGKVTAVVESKDILPKALGAEQTIGLRIPAHELIAQILQKLGVPVTGTSANRSGMPSARSAREVAAQFEGREWVPDLVIDAGELPPSKPSTIIDITGPEPKVLRA